MEITVSSRPTRPASKMLAQYKLVEETETRLVLQGKRIAALIATAVLGASGALITGVTFANFYPPLHPSDLGTLWLGGGLGIAMLTLAIVFLYFGLRRPDRILADARRGEVVFERRRKPAQVSFGQITEIAVRTKDRFPRRRERCIVHPVVVVTRDGAEHEVDASSDIEAMIRLAAKLRRVTGVALGS